jgi:hypothetical protein
MVLAPRAGRSPGGERQHERREVHREDMNRTQRRFNRLSRCAVPLAVFMATLPARAHCSDAANISRGERLDRASGNLAGIATPRTPRRWHRRVEKLLVAMSIEAKVGQVLQADIGSVTPTEVRQYQLGSVLNGGNSGPGGRDLAPAPEWLALADAFHDAR